MIIKKKKIIKKCLPTIVDTCIKWLELNIQPDWKVFEWGAGKSTIYFAQKVAEIVSIEHSKGWRDRLTRVLKQKELKNFVIHLIYPDDLLPKQYIKKKRESFKLFCDPNKYFSRHFLKNNFTKYVKIIDTYPDKYFDLILIDGRSRPACIKHAMSKIRPGGYLMLDNSERSVYNLSKQLVKDWKETLFYLSNSPKKFQGTTHLWTTTVWTKPN